MKMNLALIATYIWVTLLVFWFVRYDGSLSFEKPQILWSKVGTLFFDCIKIIWIAASILLLFINWRLPVFTLLGFILTNIFMRRAVQSLEDVALMPIGYLYKKLDDWSKKKNNENN